MNQKIKKIDFVKSPLNISWPSLKKLTDIFSGSEGDGYHWGVLITTNDGQEFLVHKLDQPTLTFEPYKKEVREFSIIPDESRSCDDLIRDVTIEEIINAAQDVEFKEYKIVRNNCIHAQNKIKKLINSLLKDASKRIPDTDITKIKQATSQYSCRIVRKLTKFRLSCPAFITNIKLHYSGLSVQEIFIKFLKEDIINFANQILKVKCFSKLFSNVLNLKDWNQIWMKIKKDMKNNSIEQLCGFLGQFLAEGGTKSNLSWTEWFQRGLLAFGLAIITNFYFVQVFLLACTFYLILFYEKFSWWDLAVRFAAILTPLVITKYISGAKTICYYFKFASDYVITLHNKYCRTKEAVWKDPCLVGGTLGFLTGGVVWVVAGSALANSAILTTLTGGLIATFPLTSLVIMGTAAGILVGAVVREIKS